MGSSYNFAVQEMLFHHHCIDCLGIFERQKPKASGAASGAVSHDGALVNFAELGEIVVKRFCRWSVSCRMDGMEAQVDCSRRMELEDSYGLLFPSSVRQ